MRKSKDNRGNYVRKPQSFSILRKNTCQQRKYRASEDAERYYLGVASPIMADGDILGCVMILMDENGQGFDEADRKIAQTAAGFLGKQMES